MRKITKRATPCARNPPESMRICRSHKWSTHHLFPHTERPPRHVGRGGGCFTMDFWRFSKDSGGFLARGLCFLSKFAYFRSTNDFWDDFRMILHGFASRNPKNGSAWSCMVLHDSIWFWMILHDSAWFCMALCKPCVILQCELCKEARSSSPSPESDDEAGLRTIRKTLQPSSAFKDQFSGP